MSSISRTYATRDAELNRFFANVFVVMGIGLAITAGITFWISQDQDLMKTLFSTYQYVENGETKQGFNASLWWWIASIAELAMVVVLCWGSIGKGMPIGGNILLFGVYAALNGVTLSPVIYSYTEASVAKVFFITAGTFGVSAIWGYMTKTNLLPLRTFFMHGLIGLIIALVVNIFYSSPVIDYTISGAAVLLFAGLTAFDMQKLEEMYSDASDSETPGLVVYGALALYLDFINMFLHLLRLFGTRK